MYGYSVEDEDFRLFLSGMILTGYIKKVYLISSEPEERFVKLFKLDERRKDLEIPEESSKKEFKEKARQEAQKNYPFLRLCKRENFIEKLIKKLEEEKDYETFHMKFDAHLIRAKLYNKINNRIKNENINWHILYKFNLLLELMLFCFRTRGLFAASAVPYYHRVKKALKASSFLEKHTSTPY